jgi:NADH:ubiquinone oxidoreductase subunit H
MIALRNETNGHTIYAPEGFSWTTLFFGGFPAIFRGDILVGILILVLNVFTMCIASVIFAFVYNKMYINKYLEKGYKRI